MGRYFNPQPVITTSTATGPITGTANNGSVWTQITPPANCRLMEIRARLGTMKIANSATPGENYISVPAGQPFYWRSSASCYVQLGAAGTIETLAYV